ncbi:MAG TPA: ATP synthase subunit I [Acidobacteriota bacterium]|nr:ATP synthase subunit I [Acidobacteriota bacterium]
MRFNQWLLGLTVAATLAACWRYGIVMAASVALGGGMAWINARWMRAGLDAVTAPEGREKAGRMTTLFVGRLLLIFLVLSVIILTSFLSVLGVIAGLSLGVVAALIDEARQIKWKVR